MVRMNPPLALLFLLAALPAAASAAAPLTLDEALAAAAQGNADLAVARTVRDAAAVDQYQSWSGVLPRLDLQGGFGHRWIGSQKSVQAVPNPATGAVDFVVAPSAAQDFADYQGTLTLRWTLFDGLSSWNRIASTRAATMAAERSLDESTLTTAFEVTRRFYEVVKQERILQVREETAVRSEELVRRADALYAAGRGTKGDTFSARVNLANDRAAVEAQRSQVVRARADLATGLGRDADPELGVVPPATLAGPGLPLLDEPPPHDVLWTRARASRPLLASRQGSLQAAGLEVSRARGAFWPILGAEGAVVRQATDLGGDFGFFGPASRQNVATARLTLSWNLFQGRETLAAEQRARVQAVRARVDLSQAEQLVSSEVARGRAQVVALARSARLAQDALGAAEEGLKLARERLDAGAASQLEVRDAALKLAEAKLALVSAVVDHAVARADLNRALGGTL
jgi:outer membrane protein TolC